MRLDNPNFNINKVNKIEQHTMNTELTFGKYKGETIKSIFEYDSAYIILFYDRGILIPDDELLKVIHYTKEYIETENEIRNENETWEDIFK